MRNCWTSLLACFAFSCTTASVDKGVLDFPTAVGILQPQAGGPFSEPIGYIANGHGGLITPVALKQGRFLTDDNGASFLRTHHLPTGHQRLLSDVVAYAPSSSEVWAIAADKRYQQIVFAPHVTDVDSQGIPVEATASIGEPTFIDADNSGDAAQLAELTVKNGWATTETWTVELGPNDLWSVRGSRSGIQEKRAETGVPYSANMRALEFTIEGNATAGDRFELSTETGLIELDAGGLPMNMRMAPDQSVVATIVQNPDTGVSAVRLLDPAQQTFGADVTLGPGSQPHRLAWSEDSQTLFVADVGEQATWSVTPDGTATRIDLPFATTDVTPLFGERRWLYLLADDLKSVHIYDLDAGQLRDLNAMIPGIQGMRFIEPLAGIEAMPLPYLYQERSDFGARLFERSVAVVSDDGAVDFMEEATGCLTQSVVGPSFSGLDADFDSSPFGPSLQPSNGSSVVVNQCAGIAQSQLWTLTYRVDLQAWEVEGTASGVQDALAYEGVRYTTDDGEFSLLIRPGIQPTVDGWTFTFAIDQGVTSTVIAGNSVIDRPADPRYFHYQVGSTDGPWRIVDERPFVAVPDPAGDKVYRIMPQEGLLIPVDQPWQ